MKFLSWLFNMNKRHYGGARRYHRGGMPHRIVSFLVITALVAGALLLERYALNSFFVDEQVVGLLLIFVAAIFVIALVELCAVYSYFGFRTASTGGLDGWLNKRAAKERAKQAQSGEGEQASTAEVPTERKRRVPKGVDIFLGIYFLVLAIATLALALFIITTVVG